MADNGHSDSNVKSEIFLTITRKIKAIAIKQAEMAENYKSRITQLVDLLSETVASAAVNDNNEMALTSQLSSRAFSDVDSDQLDANAYSLADTNGNFCRISSPLLENFGHMNPFSNINPPSLHSDTDIISPISPINSEDSIITMLETPMPMLIPSEEAPLPKMIPSSCFSSMESLPRPTTLTEDNDQSTTLTQGTMSPPPNNMNQSTLTLADISVNDDTPAVENDLIAPPDTILMSFSINHLLVAENCELRSAPKEIGNNKWQLSVQIQTTKMDGKSKRVIGLFLINNNGNDLPRRSFFTLLNFKDSKKNYERETPYYNRGVWLKNLDLRVLKDQGFVSGDERHWKMKASVQLVFD